jgi:hypothetical protein
MFIFVTKPNMHPPASLNASINRDQSLNLWLKHTPTIVTVGTIVIMAMHGRIAQLAH